MAPRLNEFTHVKSGTFFRPAFALRYRYCPIQEIALDPLGVSIPLNIGQSMLQVDRTRMTIKSQAAPIP
jgi:hypothetical protein